MNIENEPFQERYLTVEGDKSVHTGWKVGWDIFHAKGSPQVKRGTLENENHASNSNLRNQPPYDLDEIWPDTEHYDQNSPGIMDRARDLDRLKFTSEGDKCFWLNALRVPISVSYLAGCAKVKPVSVLELGTGGDSAHSTGMFLGYLDTVPGGSLISVDRHPLSRTWVRYRHHQNWTFIQGDSLNILHAMIERKLPRSPWFDMIFIDSSHEYEPTLAELRQASVMTDAMLMDDSTFPGVKQALDEWLPQNPEWLRVDLASAVSLLERHPYA